MSGRVVPRSCAVIAETQDAIATLGVASMPDNQQAKTGSSRWWQLLLLVPFVALLWVPFYNSIEPALWGIPFFYWYQFLWVLLTSAIIILVHHKSA